MLSVRLERESVDKQRGADVQRTSALPRRPDSAPDAEGEALSAGGCGSYLYSQLRLPYEDSSSGGPQRPSQPSPPFNRGPGVPCLQEGRPAPYVLLRTSRLRVLAAPATIREDGPQSGALR